MEPTWATTAAQGMRHVLLAGGGQGERPTFLWAQREARAEAPFPAALRAMRLSKEGRVETVWQVSGLAGDLEFVTLGVVDGKEGVGSSLRLRVPQDSVLSLSCTNAEARVVESRPLGVTVSSPIAARLRPDGPMSIIAEGMNSSTTPAPDLPP